METKQSRCARQKINHSTTFWSYPLLYNLLTEPPPKMPQPWQIPLRFLAGDIVPLIIISSTKHLLLHINKTMWWRPNQANVPDILVLSASLQPHAIHLLLKTQLLSRIVQIRWTVSALPDNYWSNPPLYDWELSGTTIPVSMVSQWWVNVKPSSTSLHLPTAVPNGQTCYTFPT
jgi:hypothetical protein